MNIEPSAEALTFARKLAFATIKEIAAAFDSFAAQTVAAAEQAHFFKLVDREPKPFPSLMDAVAAERAKPAASDLEQAKAFTCLSTLSLDVEELAAKFSDIRAEAVSAERERCAQICDGSARLLSGSTPHSEGMLDAYEMAAARIRAADDRANR